MCVCVWKSVHRTEYWTDTHTESIEHTPPHTEQSVSLCFSVQCRRIRVFGSGGGGTLHTQNMNEGEKKRKRRKRKLASYSVAAQFYCRRRCRTESALLFFHLFSLSFSLSPADVPKVDCCRPIAVLVRVRRRRRRIFCCCRCCRIFWASQSVSFS